MTYFYFRSHDQEILRDIPSKNTFRLIPQAVSTPSKDPTDKRWFYNMYTRRSVFSTSRQSHRLILVLDSAVSVIKLECFQQVPRRGIQIFYLQNEHRISKFSVWVHNYKPKD